MTSKLALYNAALLILGEESLANLAEARAPRRALDAAYDDGVAFCLEQGYWNHAMRTIQADSSASVTPAFGYQYAFTKPTDCVKLYNFGSTATFDPPLLEVVDESIYWFANVDPLYVKYVSSDAAYGMDLSLWSESFSDYVANHMAVKTCKRITGSKPDDGMKADEKKALAVARSKDAMDEPSKFPPQGTWVRSRRGSFADRGLSTTR